MVPKYYITWIQDGARVKSAKTYTYREALRQVAENEKSCKLQGVPLPDYKIEPDTL